MSNIRLKIITVEPSQAPLIIQNGNISITDTTVSDNMISGALIVNGGLAIKCTSDSVSSTSGGGLTLGGGLVHEPLLLILGGGLVYEPLLLILGLISNISSLLLSYIL